MSYRIVRKLASAQTLSLVVVASLIVVGLLHMRPVYGDQLPTRSIEFARGEPGITDSFKLGLTIPANETLGSIRIQFCVESPLIGQPCTLPTGMDISGVNLIGQTGITNFTVLSSSGDSVVLTRSAALVFPVDATFTFSGVVNPANAGSYFGRIQTYVSQDATGASTDYGGLAFAMEEAVQISATVPPYLYFCAGITITNTDCSTATGDYVNFGDFTTALASVAQTQMVAGTNADTGYTIQASGTTLTSGNNTIPALATPDTSRPGTSQFGLNLVANQDPTVGQNPSGLGNGQAAVGYNQPNLYKFVPSDVVALVNTPDEARKYTVSYIANISKTQPPGVYASTMTYVATAGF